MPTEKPEGYSSYSMAEIDRYMCDVLDEMRKCHEHRNYAMLPSLIEEVQIMGNRMENKLHTYKKIAAADEYVRRLKENIAELEKREKELEGRK